jgi:hypothetical protein
MTEQYEKAVAYVKACLGDGIGEDTIKEQLLFNYLIPDTIIPSIINMARQQLEADAE